MSEIVRMKPLFLVKPKTMSPRDIRRAEKLAGICIVECEDPDSARFLQPPVDAQLDVQARAALALMRLVLQSTDPNFSRATLTKWFVEQLMYAPQPAAVKGVKTK